MSFRYYYYLFFVSDGVFILVVSDIDYDVGGEEYYSYLKSMTDVDADI